MATCICHMPMWSFPQSLSDLNEHRVLVIVSLLAFTQDPSERTKRSDRRKGENALVIITLVFWGGKAQSSAICNFGIDMNASGFCKFFFLKTISNCLPI